MTDEPKHAEGDHSTEQRAESNSATEHSTSEYTIVETLDGRRVAIIRPEVDAGRMVELVAELKRDESITEVNTLIRRHINKTVLEGMPWIRPLGASKWRL